MLNSSTIKTYATLLLRINRTQFHQKSISYTHSNRTKAIIKTMSSLSSSSLDKVVLSVQKLADGPMETIDPFLFCVYHKDAYPAGALNMYIYIYRERERCFCKV